ncbi:hypothetical protein FHT40_006092 [Mycolicibacterium sp. BK556]|nr:hypothetical protein [Mycolicibacterium sp. BK556]MBB3636353.1 hypothetical protein [Mycolicibacterium sp. BK607]TDO06507.1 hypothetical protein EV580_6599 [Mycobacterium sp. BK086]
MLVSEPRQSIAYVAQRGFGLRGPHATDQSLSEQALRPRHVYARGWQIRGDGISSTEHVKHLLSHD